LTHLSLHRCRQVKDLRPLERLSQLTELNLG
jgi:hypothetical protein